MPSGTSKMAHDSTRGARRGKQAPQDGPRRDPRGARRAPRGAQGPPRGLKGSLWGAQMGAKRRQEGPKRPPRWPERAPVEAKMTKNAKCKNVKKTFGFHWFLVSWAPQVAPEGGHLGPLGRLPGDLGATWGGLVGSQVIAELFKPGLSQV